jgi:phosphatidylglycerophosphatase A
MKKAITIFIATGVYTGYSPVMPGTVGTLWGILIAYLEASRPIYTQALVIALVLPVSVFFAGKAALLLGGDDPKNVVCDEVCGFLVSIFLIKFTFLNAILVFLLFRFFDILKPYPVGLIDRKVRGGLGIVLDDVAAGIYANICAHIILWLPS